MRIRLTSRKVTALLQYGLNYCSPDIKGQLLALLLHITSYAEGPRFEYQPEIWVSE
jgi:hypothetical protein